MNPLLFIYPNISSFVKKDIDIMCNSYKILEFKLENNSKIKTLLSIVHLICFLCLNSKSVSFYITQFAGYQSVLPTFFGKLFNIKSFIILGGTDCNWLPSINYGNNDKFLLKWATRYSLKNAYHLIPVNKELVECDYGYTDNDFPKQGYKSFFNDISTPYTVISNGIDLDIYSNYQQHRKSKTFITTCSELQNDRRRLVKGIDLVLELAKLNPDCSFTIVGGILPTSFNVLKNITTIPFIENDLLPDLLNKHQYYLQLSLTEGFPNALIEAMACGCVPIVSAVGAMPDIVENVGYILEKKDITLLQKLIDKAINEFTIQKSLIVRKRAEDFDIKFRKKQLLDLLDHHLNTVTSP